MGKACANTLDVPFGWSFVTIPGVGHQGNKMFRAYVAALFNTPNATSNL